MEKCKSLREIYIIVVSAEKSEEKEDKKKISPSIYRTGERPLLTVWKIRKNKEELTPTHPSAENVFVESRFRSIGRFSFFFHNEFGNLKNV